MVRRVSYLAGRNLHRKEVRMEFRTGIGYDCHPLSPGKKLVLGGISIPHTARLRGHSDGDVLLHALVDALLGASQLGDIGARFPDSDPRWKDMASRYFVEQTRKWVKQEKFEITFVDCILLAEKPKLQPYFPEIRKKISTLLEIQARRVSVKAKTQEGLGFIGRKKGIAAFVAVTLRHGEG